MHDNILISAEASEVKNTESDQLIVPGNLV